MTDAEQNLIKMLDLARLRLGQDVTYTAVEDYNLDDGMRAFDLRVTGPFRATTHAIDVQDVPWNELDEVILEGYVMTPSVVVEYLHWFGMDAGCMVGR